jgi:hypothetical protein
MSFTGLPKPGFFYPQITGGGYDFFFEDPAQAILGAEQAIGSENVSGDGSRERLHQRYEQRVTLRFVHVDATIMGINTNSDSPHMGSLYHWWKNWGSLGKQSALVLDRWTPPAPTAADGGAGSVEDTYRTWVYAFVANGMEYPASPPSNEVSAANRRWTVTFAVGPGTVDGGPTGTTARKIYRTTGHGLLYKADANGRRAAGLLFTVADNTTVSVSDNFPDASLGVVVPLPGSLERNLYNRAFTKAELVSMTWAPVRSLPSLSRDLYALELVFRQGT